VKGAPFTLHPLPFALRPLPFALKIMYVMISYDIKSDIRRQKIYNTLKDYGTWVQYSVFECHISEQEYRALCHRLKPLIHEEEADNIRIYQLCGECHQQIERLGGTPTHDTVKMIV
jgi:CRISPR-associated protein Cas2